MNQDLDPRAVELINLELDGRLDPSGQAELAARQAADPAVAAARERHRALHAALASVPSVEPPLGFATRVVARAKLPASKSRAATGPGLLARLLAPAPLRYAGAFAAGVVMAVIVGFGGIRGGGFPDDPAALTGALVRKDAGRISREDGAGVQRVELRETALQGEVAMARRQDLTAVEFELDSPDAVDIAVELLGTGLSFGGLAETGQALPPLTLDGPRLLLRSTGVRHFTLLLSTTPDAAGSVRVSFSREGALIRAATLPVSSAP